MTTDTQPLAPTDADIDALWVGQQLTVPQLVQRRVIARAALAKWGAQPAVAGEPVMWAYQYSDGSWHDASATEHSSGMKPLYPAPQPTQAQAGAVPLTDREIELIDGMIQVQLDHASRCDAIANRSMADKQKGWDMERVALLQKFKAHGIKGGQHGTE